MLALDYKSLGSKRSLSFDTETILGYAKLLTLGNGSHHFIDSFESAMAILEQHSTVYFGWNAFYDVLGILKYLPLTNQMEIAKDGKTVYDHYWICYVKDKFCRIKDLNTGLVLSFYDLMQYFKVNGHNVSLDKASEIHLNKHKVENDLEKEFKALNAEVERMDVESYQNKSSALYVVKGKDFLSETKKRLIQRMESILHMDDFVLYAVQDAILTQELLEIFKQTMIDMGLDDVKGFSSPANIMEQYFMRFAEQNGIELPDCKRLDPKFVDDIKKFYKGGIFMTLKRGSFNDVANLDVSSAYPYQLSKMPNLLDGEFKLIRDQSEFDALLDQGLECSDGLYRLLGWVDVGTDNPFIGSRDKHGNVVYRTGYRKEKITLFEYAVLKRHNKPIDFIRAWVWVKTKDEHKAPFRDFIQMLYTERKRYAKGTSHNLMLKEMMNSLYGKTSQGIRNGFTGWLTNPFYASSITGGLRAQIIDRIYTDGIENRVIMISTDGLLVLNEGKYREQSAKGLGDWDIEIYGSALVHRCGIYELYRDGKAVITKTRGVNGDGFSSKDENGQYFTLRSLFERYRNESKAPVHTTHNVSLGEVFRFNKGKQVRSKYAPEHLNYILTEDKNESIEDKRMRWHGIKTFGDLLTNSYDAELYDASTSPIDIALIEFDGALKALRASKQHSAIVLDGIELKTSFKAFLDAYMASHGHGELEFISYVQYATLKFTNSSKDNSCLFNHKSNGSITILDNKWFWEDFGKYKDLQTALHPSVDPSLYRTEIREVIELRSVEDEQHPSVYKVLLDGGKLSPYYRSKKKRESAQRMSEVLYRLNGSKLSDAQGYPSVVFPNHDGYDIYIVLTFPHSDKALSLTENDYKSIAKEFLDRYTRMLCKRKSFPSDAQYAASLNYHPVKTKAIFDKHPHIDVHLLNALFSKSKQKFYRFNPRLTESELGNVKALWKNVLRSHGLLDDESKKIDLKWSFIWLGKKRVVAQALYYSARSFTWDLLNYISLHDLRAQDLTDAEISMVDYLTSYNNRRQPLGFWSKLSQYANSLDDSQLTEECPVCQESLTVVHHYNAEEGLDLLAQSSYFLVDCGHERYKFYVRTIDGGGG